MIIKLNETFTDTIKSDTEILITALDYLKKNYGNDKDYKFSMAQDELGKACIKWEDTSYSLGFRKIEPDYYSGREPAWRFSSTLYNVIDALQSDVHPEISFDYYEEIDDQDSDYERIAYVMIYPSYY